MQELPKRKRLRLDEYDYASAGAYFITVCVKDKRTVLWDNVGAATSRPHTPQLSKYGRIVDAAIRQIPERYPNVSVNKYCVMPDHVHLILVICDNDNGRQIAAPTISTIVGQMKRWASLQAGFSLWQRSFVDRVIRDEKAYLAVWEYIDNNPLKLDTAEDMPDFSEM